MSKSKLIALLCVLVACLSGCGNIHTSDGDQSVNSETSYKLKDGRTVTCIYGPGGRLSCDWAGAK